MTQRATLTAERREAIGKAAKKLRRQGIIPASLYGKGLASQAIQVNAHDLERFIATHGAAALVDLHLDGNKTGETVMVQQIQRESVSYAIQHVDFLHIIMSQPIRVHVRVRLEGEAPAIKRENGVLLQVLEAVEIEALPANLPEAVTLDISGLEELRAMLHVGDIVAPSDVTILTPADEVVVKIEAPRILEAPAEAAEAAPAATASGSEAASESGGAEE